MLLEILNKLVRIFLKFRKNPKISGKILRNGGPVIFMKKRVNVRELFQ